MYVHIYIYLHTLFDLQNIYLAPTHRAKKDGNTSMIKLYMHTSRESKQKGLIILTVKHCIFSGRLVSGAAPWFDSTASEM